LKDSYGDGWSYNSSVAVKVNGTAITGSPFTLPPGMNQDSIDFTFTILNGGLLTMTYSSDGGTWEYEHLYDLLDETGSVIYTNGTGITPITPSTIPYISSSCGATAPTLFATTTTINGDYIFSDIPDGEYIVSVLDAQNILTGLNDNPTTQGNESDILLNGNSFSITDTATFTNGLTNNWSFSIGDIDTITNVDFAYEPILLDFGDLPIIYSTTYANINGPRHEVNSSWTLGATIDTEDDGVPTVDATGDGIDEDGVTFHNAGNWQIGQVECITISYSIPEGESAQIIGWIDWNMDGSFVGDVVIDSIVTNTNATTLDDTVRICMTVPSDAGSAGDGSGNLFLYSRFRLFPQSQFLPEFQFTGFPNGTDRRGEVEDYRMEFELLPIEMGSFNGESKDCNIEIEWVTLTEINNAMFIIQRSINGIHFETIGTVEGYGNSSEKITYTFIDNQIVSGAYYYRIVDVDFDGNKEYSRIISVIAKECFENNFMVYPNPTNNLLNVDLNIGTKGQIIINIVNLIGAQILKKKIDVNQGNNTTSLDLGNVASGVYFIDLEMNMWKSESVMFIKLK
jgi:hypothetical protein